MTGRVRNSPRVLYVEDEKDVREPISQMLKFLGYEVECAINGQAGVEHAERWRPDIILMDIRMPVLDGIEATRILRNNPSTEDIPIFILSAYTNAKTRQACELAGASGFFAKPIDIEKIDAAIKETVNKRSRASS
jgi:CheY-like chemotaxis protein